MSDSKPPSSWGVTWTYAIPHSIDHDCEGCGKWSFSGGAQEDINRIVGFEYAPEPGFMSEKVGKLIVECPKCGSKFWWHIRIDTVTVLRDRGLCPQWPID
jgi:hypothetical protein